MAEEYDTALVGSTAYRTFIDEDGIIEITHEVRAISQLVVGGEGKPTCFGHVHHGID